MQDAQKGNITDEIKLIAETEGVDVHKIVKNLANGRIVILKNIEGKSRPLGVGKGLKTKDQRQCRILFRIRKSGMGSRKG